MTESERQKFYKENKPLRIGAAALMASATIAVASGIAGSKATAVFVINEIKDEVVSNLTGGIYDFVDLSKILTKLGKEGIETLSNKVRSNLKRFEKNIPSNSKESVEVFQADDGSTIFTATSPGEIEGSKAIYTKTVNSKGTTTGFTKSTIDPEGNIVHVKDKITGDFIIDNRKK